MDSTKFALLSISLLLGLGGCGGPRTLETTLGGHTVDSLQAQALKVDGQWQCELVLPLGHWRVETAEGQTLEVLQNEPRATLRWKVAPDRWAQQDRPFRFELVGEAGLRLPLAVRYPNTLPKAAEVVLQVLRGTLPI